MKNEIAEQIIDSPKVSSRFSLKNFLLGLYSKYKQQYRYILVSAFGQAYNFLGMFVLVHFLKVNETLSFILVYGFGYIWGYLLTVRYVFSHAHSNVKLLKYILHTVFFLAVGSLLFHGLVLIHINYMIATFLTIVLLFPVRFIVYKLLVFK